VDAAANPPMPAPTTATDSFLPFITRIAFFGFCHRTIAYGDRNATFSVER